MIFNEYLIIDNYPFLIILELLTTRVESTRVDESTESTRLVDSKTVKFFDRLDSILSRLESTRLVKKKNRVESDRLNKGRVDPSWSEPTESIFYKVFFLQEL